MRMVGSGGGVGGLLIGGQSTSISKIEPHVIRAVLKGTEKKNSEDECG